MENMKHIYLFLSGMILAFDFTGLFGKRLIHNSTPIERKSDADNIASDWDNVGKTLKKAMKNGFQQ